MIIEQKIEETLLLDEDLYFLTPTKELFETVVNLFKVKFKNYVPNAHMEYWNYDWWDFYKEETHLYYKKNSILEYGNIFYENSKQINLQTNVTIKEKLEEALIKGEEFYIHTPTFDNFSYIICLLTSEFRNYVPAMSFNAYNYNMWSDYKENTYLFYWKDDTFAYGGKSSINNKDKYFLNLFNSQEEIIEHTYTISIGEYSGKLIIPKEALQLLKDGTKVKIV